MYWSFSIHPSNEYSGLISFRKDWFDLLAVQGTLKSLQISFLIENFFLYFFGCAMWHVGSLGPQSGMEPMPPSLDV